MKGTVSHQRAVSYAKQDDGYTLGLYSAVLRRPGSLGEDGTTVAHSDVYAQDDFEPTLVCVEGSFRGTIIELTTALCTNSNRFTDFQTRVSTIERTLVTDKSGGLDQL